MDFIDTNVLLYAVSTAEAEQDKATTAQKVLARHDLAVSAQVLGEFYVRATRANKPGRLAPADAAAIVDRLSRLPVQPITTAVVARAIAASQRWQISYWDAAILEAARALGCDTVLSEDLADGHDYDGVAVRNPFAG